eukprot:2821210-Rhodomonas_salina.4
MSVPRNTRIGFIQNWIEKEPVNSNWPGREEGGEGGRGSKRQRQGEAETEDEQEEEERTSRDLRRSCQQQYLMKETSNMLTQGEIRAVGVFLGVK